MPFIIKSINQQTINREIILNGKNLIIVGVNGSGKTKFLQNLDIYLKNVIKTQNPESLLETEITLAQQKTALNSLPKDTTQHNNFMRSVKIMEESLERKKLLDIAFFSSTEISSIIQSNKFIYRFFPALRKYESVSPTRISSIHDLHNEYSKKITEHTTLSSNLENYLVSISNYSLLEKGAGNIDEYTRIEKIIKSIEIDLQKLFEDVNLKLSFNTKKLRMEIIQKGKEPLGFDLLPSGFSSILSIYAELAMFSLISNEDNNSIKGVVLIDEIDVHLHVSLQKKIFNFLCESYPKIQFIISTHSPFVVQSVSNSIIYNITDDVQLEDLSLYSYSSIVKGLLGENDASDTLKKLADEMISLADNNMFNDRFKYILQLLENDFENLDSRSKAVFVYAKNKQIDVME